MQRTRSTKPKRKIRSANILEMQGRLIDAVGVLGEAIIDSHAAPPADPSIRREKLFAGLSGVYAELNAMASHVGYTQESSTKAPTELRLAR